MDFIPLEAKHQQLLSAEQAWHYGIIPKASTNDHLEFFIDEKQSVESTREELELLFGKCIVLIPFSSLLINTTLGKYYRRTNSEHRLPRTVKNEKNNDDFLSKLISEAKRIGSSDIHIESYENRSRIRMRIDGKMIERYDIEKTEYPALINKIKIRANLDIAEKRLPQDGRILFNEDEMKFDIRVSVIPTLYGEKIVLRILNKDSSSIEIEELGFSDRQKQDYLEAVRKTSGIILISGPTGSGKTTTLYATLRILNKEESNIITIEDPIEYTLTGINQVQLKEAIGLTFATALRTFLRQDPDIIMLGEIRDGETAQMAIRAALTGHLVLSTIHTNSAWGTISRLLDMGVPPFLVAGTLNLSVSQRLVRVLCPYCKKAIPFNPSLLPTAFNNESVPELMSVPVGCSYCFYTGYKGRRAVFEVIPIEREVAIKIKEGDLNVQPLLAESGIQKMADTAFGLFKQGLTTMDEIYPILLNDEF